ncbi:MAG TPA: asparagine synthase (glutamine-hydrolyzing) [Terriglobia bacterium]|nr:asparagine synthase (glutamine-hydrolyzing) [Terriglobia bacterium]
MCGISGVVQFDDEPVSHDCLAAMIDCVRHRGPDAIGYLSDGPAAFAHARLSIIDVSGGLQPMSNEDGSLWVTFNGEIFNYVELRRELIAAGYRFRTQSDTEVILHMYAHLGEQCVERFNGEWAFAIWDKRARQLFLSRDRFGIRPLFYTRTPHGFAFASEIKSLLALPEVGRDVDLETLDQVFTFWSGLPGRTMFRGIQELQPGHSLTLRDRKIEVQRYWTLDYSSVNHGMREDACAEAMLELLQDATRIRLRSDVPVGMYLSGGLDSSLITALTLRHSHHRPRTFSVNFDDAQFDESAHQMTVVRFLGTEHESVRCSYQDICNVFPEVIRHTETPILRTAPAPFYLLSQMVHRNGYKVVLTGEGADEFMGGYDIFKEAKIRRFWSANPASRLRPLLLRRLYPHMQRLQSQPDAYRAAFFHIDAQELSDEFFSHLPRWNLTSKLKAFFSADVQSAIGGADGRLELRQRLPESYRSWDIFAQSQFLEASALLPGYLLSSQGDRMAMANAVEGRFPFLDHRLVEFTTRMPAHLKMKVLNEKYILKRVARLILPPSIIKRSKQPYRAPDTHSFIDVTTGKARAAYVDELLDPGAIRRFGLFDAAAVGKLVEKARKGLIVGIKDDMAFVGILSTQLLMDQFTQKGERYAAN